MPMPIETITTAALSAALETASRRQAAVAANIANASTPGYVPQRVSFDAHLAQARSALAERGALDAAAVDSLRAEAEPAFDASGQAAVVQLDAEMSELARNGVEYQALVQGLSRHLGLLALAAGDGRK
ncbi:flagellar basal body rod protein FlgB [Ramlibacter alkalitolerans]|uniref:Flagellar basal body rod protein FlgB n=1 Tax=Ramlibacter alkalitolerans TaxID=2039631 RepID=A0ABS1JU64_9BURK|nr:flagellar basal body rod protein FlgB [Ramlibacter alkalitolerans]MBL0427396.1 flagellar basal body rod protein FlgB [Ramlibacter alkalitolerans]